MGSLIWGVTLGKSLSPLDLASPSEVPVLKLIPGRNEQGKKHPGPYEALIWGVHVGGGRAGKQRGSA